MGKWTGTSPAAVPRDAVIGDSAPQGTTVSVPMPRDTAITVHDLTQNTLADERYEKLLEGLKTAKVRFVILNAPFKLRPVGAVS